MDIYVNGQTDSVVSGSALVISTSPYPINPGTPPTLDTTSALSDSVNTTDVQYYVSSASFTGLSSKTSYTKSVSLTCSTASTTSISYNLVSYNGQTLPSWVSLDISNQQIKFTTPCVTTSTTYQFAVQATISGTNTQTPVSLTVTPPSTGCPTYSSTISSSTTTAVAATSVTAVSAATVTTSLVSGGSPQSLWAMINQFQFFMLYPMIGAYVPDNIIDFLQGVNFCLFNFNFIPIPKSGPYKSFLNFFDCDQTSSYMSTIGLESVCMIVNQVKFVLVLIFVMILHLVVIILFKCTKREMNCWFKLIGYLFMFFTLSIYLRTIFEAFLGVLLSSFNEFYIHDFSSNGRMVSFCISVIIVVGLITFWISTFVIAKYASKSNYDPEATYLHEVVVGTKKNFRGRLLFFTTITKIILSISIIIFGQNMGMYARISIYVFIQIIFMIITLIVRHYEAVSDNIIQILNDSIYLTACISLFRYNKETNWANGFVTAFLSTITVNGLIITLIQLIVLFRELFIIYINWRKAKSSRILNEHNLNAQRMYLNKPVLNNFAVHKIEEMKEEESKVSKSSNLGTTIRYFDKNQSENSIVVSVV